MRKCLGILLAVLLLLCSFALAEEQPTVTFATKSGSVNGGFVHKALLNVSKAQAEAFDVTVTDDGGKTYTVTFPAGEKSAELVLETEKAEATVRRTLTVAEGDGYTPGAKHTYTLDILRLPVVEFSSTTNIGGVGKKATVGVKCSNHKSILPDNNVFTLKDHQGNVLAEKVWKNPADKLTFAVDVTPEMEGRHDLTVWLGDECVSRSAFGSFTDQSRKVIRRVETDDPYISITIDCNWYNGHGEEILDVLDKYGVKVTFFLTGNYLRLFPETVERMIASGHEIANHTNTHMRQTQIGDYTKLREIQIPCEIESEVYGIKPRFFRPPYGAFDKVTTGVARGMGMELCLWSIDSNDWKVENQYHKDVILKRVKKNVVPGTIILFHIDGYGTAQTLDTVIPYYTDELGLNCVPVSELLKHSDHELPAIPEGVYGADEETRNAGEDPVMDIPVGEVG